MAEAIATGIVICKDKALVFKDKYDNASLPKFAMQEGEDAIDAFCIGIRRATGITRNQLMFVKEMGCSTVSQANKEQKTYCLLWKTFLFELPQSYKGQRMDWVEIRQLRRVLTDSYEKNFCKIRASEIYNAKYDMKHTPPRYPQEGVRW